MRRPRCLKPMPLPRSECVPTMMSMRPSARSFLIAAASFAVTSRESCSMRSGSPAKRSLKVRKCWRASKVVGTTTATWVPLIAATNAARKRHLGLAESDIAADEPVHRPARGHVGERVENGAVLILGLGIGKARGEFLVHPLGPRHALAFLELALGGDGDQFVGDVPDALLDARLARLPRRGAEPVELGARHPPSRSATAPRCSRPARRACRRRHR